MTQTSEALPDSPPLSPAARLLWLALILATLYLCYFHNLGAIGLVGPDEPRYAWIARDMQETGDWVTPHLYGKPWFEKPPLYYWGAALSFKFFGVSEVSARLPSALSALLATLALAWLALRLYGAETACWLLLLLPTTVGMIGFSHAAATDMPFAATLTIAMVFTAKLLKLVPSPSPQSQSTATSPSALRSFTSFTSSTSFTSFLFGVFLGLATLAKGPAAIILSGGAVLLWAAITKRWRDAFRCLHPVAIASFCLTALPWYILCALRNPDFFRVFIIEHNFKRFLTPEFQHIQPFWYYIPISLLAVFPWTLLFLASIYSFCRKTLREKRISPGGLFCFCWALFPLLFFSISKSKLPGYILPSFPMLTLLMARSTSAVNVDLRRSAVCSISTSAIASAVGGFILSAVPNLLPHKFQDLQYPAAYILISLAITFSLIASSLLMKHFSVSGVLIRAIGFAVFLFVLSTSSDKKAFGRFGIWNYSARDLSHSLLAYGGTSENLRLVGLNRSAHYQLNFYLHADLQVWDGTAKPGELLVGDSISCTSLRLGSSCKDLWGMMDKTDEWELLEISPTNSLSGLGGSGGSGGSGSGGSTNNLSNRQPR